LIENIPGSFYFKYDEDGEDNFGSI